ncbi:uncharacterized protein LOC130613188 [Hydractinia symbiolongicarpus]|uniref:uncharacterized protein LOC130613188 n=1 Tax=Hydractinia symbiolongicarpus TaxID=13093 RepID=UPI00254C60DB|nr:uncharacterized protein LOC130613188 [Hydractinia symbiolongicarpus]
MSNFTTNTTNATNGYICLKTGGKSSPEVRYIVVGASIVVMLLIISSNSILIRALRSGKCTRTDKYFLVLSVSDLCVGLFAVPSVLLLYVGFTEETLCAIFPFVAFFLVSPYLFSWVMTIIISIDRCVLVTHPNFHSGFCKPVLKYFIPFCLLGTVGVGISFFLHDFYEENILLKMSDARNYRYKLLITQVLTTGGGLLLTIAVGATQIYLMLRVRSNMAKMDGNRHANVDYNRRITDTIAMMFFSAALCNIFYMVIFTLTHFMSKDFETTYFMIRLSNAASIVLYSNSFFNSIILLTRSSKLKKQTIAKRK